MGKRLSEAEMAEALRRGHDEADDARSIGVPLIAKALLDRDDDLCACAEFIRYGRIPSEHGLPDDIRAILDRVGGAP